MPWDIIVLDERYASKSFAQKMYPVLHELSPKQRVAMRESSGDATSDQLLAWAAFLRPSQYKVRVRSCAGSTVQCSRSFHRSFFCASVGFWSSGPCSHCEERSSVLICC
jgi:hypothetical protein